LDKVKNFLFPPKGTPKSAVREWVETILVAGAIALVIRTFILQIFYIPSGSMIPTLHPKDRIIGLMFTYRFREPQRHDIIIFKFPEDPSKNFIKRLMGFPGEEIKIRDGQVFINDVLVEPRGYQVVNDHSYFGPVRIPENHYLVLGDNRPNSADSRVWGFLPVKNVKGTGWVRIWPPSRLGFYR
jgi:signal peptidase I